jgi:CheY-like chemotaxis protein/two-component sensor histidine kinase
MATLGMLAAGIGHEISNPLATVMLNNGALTNRLARAGLPAAPLTEAQRLLAENDEALDRIRSIVGELRTFARKAQLRAIVESSIRLCRAQLRGIEVKLELPMLPVVRGSSARLGQVLLNLLVNAAHALAGTEKPRIWVNASTMGDEVMVVVTDNGPGVPPELAVRVFDMFFTTKGPGEGTGLGLGIAKDIAERHGGRLELESKPGAGASFRLILPVRAVESTETRPRAPSSPAIKPARRKPSLPALASQPPTSSEPRPRVLIVDDEVMILRALERELATDFEVVAVSSGDEAVAAWGKSRFDAVLCDVNLVGESGLDVSGRLAAIDPGCAQRTIFMSGGPSSAKVRQTVAAAPGRFVAKPFDMVALVKLIRGLVAPT